jgi:hypothetical protein
MRTRDLRKQSKNLKTKDCPAMVIRYLAFPQRSYCPENLAWAWQQCFCKPSTKLESAGKKKTPLTRPQQNYRTERKTRTRHFKE